MHEPVLGSGFLGGYESYPMSQGLRPYCSTNKSSDSVDEIITASEDLKLETKADANSEMDETMKPKLNVELKEDAGQGSIDSETRL